MSNLSIKKIIIPLLLLSAVLPLSADDLFNNMTGVNPSRFQAVEDIGTGGVYICKLTPQVQKKKYNATREQKEPEKTLLPSGIRFAYTLTLPLTSPVKDIYTDMHGVDLTYLYFFNDYVSLRTGISSVAGIKQSTNSNTLQNSFGIGLNFGFPVIGFIPNRNWFSTAHEAVS